MAPKCYKTQEMCHKAVNSCFFVSDSIPDQYKLQEICDIAVSLYPFSISYCSDKYKTQKMCDKAVDNCLAALKSIADWFVTSKMLENCDNVLHANNDIRFANNDIPFYYEDFDKAALNPNQKHTLSVDLDEINLDNNFDEDDLDTIIHIRFLGLHSNFKNHRAFKEKISEELMPVAWHPKWSWNFCMTEVYNLEAPRHFVTENYTQRLDIVQKSLLISWHFGHRKFCMKT